MHREWRVWLLCLGSAWLCAAGARADVASCVDAADRGQVERDARSFEAARASFVECSDAACPEAVRKECIRWLADVEARRPSLVIVVRDPGGVDVPDAEISLDGKVLEGAVGRELPIDPGEHEVIARHDGVEARTTVVASEREQGRRVTLELAPRHAEPAAPPQNAPEPRRRRSWVGPAITVGTGAVLLGTAGILTLRGKSDAQDLRETCAPSCSSKQVDDIDRKLHVADAMLGVGIAAVGAGVLWWLWPERKPAKSSVRVGVSGRGLSLSGSF